MCIILSKRGHQHKQVNSSKNQKTMKPVPQNQIQEPTLYKRILKEQGEGLINNQSLLEVRTYNPQIISLQSRCNFLNATMQDDLEKVNQKLRSINEIESAAIDNHERKEALNLLRKVFKLQRIFKSFIIKIQTFEDRLKGSVNQLTATNIQEFISDFKDLRTEAGLYQEMRFLIGRQILQM